MLHSGGDSVKSGPKVSVILTSYNRPAYLKQAIDSVLNQTFQDWELIVMDDNSPNSGVLDLLMSQTDPRVSWYISSVTDEERLLTARYVTLINQAFGISKGKYTTYLTDDDFYIGNRLGVMSRALDEDSAKHIVYGGQIQIDEYGNVTGYRNGIGVITGSAACLVDHNSFMHRREVFNASGGWDDDPSCWGHGDAAFLNRVHEAGYYLYPVPGFLDVHRHHSGSVQSRMIAGLSPIPKE